MSKAYHIANVRLTGYPEAAVIAVAEFAQKMGVQAKIGGLPFGAAYSGPPGESYAEEVVTGQGEQE